MNSHRSDASDQVMNPMSWRKGSAKSANAAAPSPAIERRRTSAQAPAAPTTAVATPAATSAPPASPETRTEWWNRSRNGATAI